MASFHWVGKIPDEIDLLKIFARAANVDEGNFLSIERDMLSDPTEAVIGIASMAYLVSRDVMVRREKSAKLLDRRTASLEDGDGKEWLSLLLSLLLVN